MLKPNQNPQFITVEDIVNTISDLTDAGIVELATQLSQLPLTNETPGIARCELFDRFISAIRMFHSSEINSRKTIADQITILVSSAVAQGQTLSIDQIRALIKSTVYEYLDEGFEEIHYYKNGQWFAEFHFNDGSSTTYGED